MTYINSVFIKILFAVAPATREYHRVKRIERAVLHVNSERSREELHVIISNMILTFDSWKEIRNKFNIGIQDIKLDAENNCGYITLVLSKE